jgi:hypothetical protein
MNPYDDAKFCAWWDALLKSSEALRSYGHGRGAEIRGLRLTDLQEALFEAFKAGRAAAVEDMRREFVSNLARGDKEGRQS